MAEISESELHQQAKHLCATHGQKNLLQKKIDHITYMAPVDKKRQKTRMLRWGILAGVCTVVSWTIFALGIWKLIELIDKLWE